MNHEILILYGSRARGDAGPAADVDLMLVTRGDRPQAPIERAGVSLHRYPAAWLLTQARSGDLFAYHVGHEGVPLQDGDGFLLDLRSAFVRRLSYAADVAIGLSVARLLVTTDWGLDEGLRRRFFWGVRTCLIALTAETGEPTFSARDLEARSGVEGVWDLLARRNRAGFEECRALCVRTELALGRFMPKQLAGDDLRTFLMEAGGYAAECALDSERSHWEGGADAAVYA